MKNLKKLRLAHATYIAKCRALGDRIIEVAPPCGCPSIETRAAPRRQVWDSLATCVHCGEIFFLITRGAKAEGLQIK